MISCFNTPPNSIHRLEKHPELRRTPAPTTTRRAGQPATSGHRRVVLATASRTRFRRLHRVHRVFCDCDTRKSHGARCCVSVGTAPAHHRLKNSFLLLPRRLWPSRRLRTAGQAGQPCVKCGIAACALLVAQPLQGAVVLHKRPDGRKACAIPERAACVSVQSHVATAAYQAARNSTSKGEAATVVQTA